MDSLLSNLQVGNYPKEILVERGEDAPQQKEATWETLQEWRVLRQAQTKGRVREVPRGRKVLHPRRVATNHSKPEGV